MSLYVIEARDENGKLDLTGPQPEQVFGLKAITGITADEMAKAIYRRPQTPRCLVLDGREVTRWATAIDRRWVARVKTW